ncbi:SPOR domain-containing protein [Roseobacter fucihabitans]|uniref:SPOR domain-containing protein n=1 Tax=Roseobacter fucihabitans TaxID=1537242 RepID=UPI00387033DD
MCAVLTACDDTGAFSLGNPSPSETTVATAQADAGTIVERDIEAPEIFSAKEPGLWDGRPSLGGVWVAHPDVTEPERVIIRNQSNGQFVVGALFRRERDIPGPRLQMSSDAAQALDVLPGAPVELDVTALRKEVVSTPEPAPVGAAQADGIGETSLASPPEPALQSTPIAPPAQTAERPPSSLTKPFIQIGIFSLEANANRAAKQMRGAGLIPTIKSQETDGKAFWRVIVGPASNTSERKKLLDTIRREGFTDAYTVSN